MQDFGCETWICGACWYRVPLTALRVWGLTRAGTALASGPGVPWSRKGSKTCGQGAKHVAKEQGGSREGLLQQLELNGDVVFSPLGSSRPRAPSRAAPEEPCLCLRGAGRSPVCSFSSSGRGSGPVSRKARARQDPAHTQTMGSPGSSRVGQGFPGLA